MLKANVYTLRIDRAVLLIMDVGGNNKNNPPRSYFAFGEIFAKSQDGEDG